MILKALFFYLFAGVTVASAFMVIASRNPVTSVLFLILAFVNSAGLFILVGAEYLALLLVVVYVGAVAVLFLFVVMMLDVDFVELRQGFLQYMPVGALIGLILLVELLMGLGAWIIRAGPPGPRCRADAGGHRDEQHSGARIGALHQIHLLLPGRGPGAAGGHDRGDRPDPAPQAERQASKHSGTGCA